MSGAGEFAVYVNTGSGWAADPERFSTYALASRWAVARETRHIRAIVRRVRA